MKEFAFRTPIDLPALRAEAGDWIEYRRRRPGTVYVIRAVPLSRALEAFRGASAVADVVPLEESPAAPMRHLRVLEGGGPS